MNLALLKQKDVRALDVDAEGRELADTEVADVLRDDADDRDVRVAAIGQDGCDAGCRHFVISGS